MRRVIVAVPLALAARVYVNVPSDATDGPLEKSGAFVLPVISNDTVCELSFAGPALIAVAHGDTVCGPASSFTVWSAPLVKLGASFTELIVMVNVWGALVSTPPFNVPPSSWLLTVTVALPNAVGAPGYVGVPVAEIAGGALNSALLSFVTMKSTGWVSSSAGPALIAVAQPATVLAGASSLTV